MLKRIKKNTAVCRSAVCAAAWLVLCFCAETAAAVPQLVCDAPVFDFGRLNSSGAVTNVFILRNDGEVSFAVQEVRAGCGCMKTELSKYIIGPGETAELTAVFTAENRRGPQNRRIWVIPVSSGKRPAGERSEEGATRPLILYMRGVVDW